ncbi:MAG: Response regulator containing a CheY-like receiver domain and an HD-GYP domain [uncultured Sulfurovum sp.]|uniref:Response regulator containing a CheY-like receiver domain and an HD-GYP domain n=1 Tax=uncultured Sulfurovum sp. TaxID=269237 RepID=A0A6S6SF84_9BACT|nr:MAG: Response regulator containing a CheY-like receiver domain and an HD-GYP domain [uncultured Sulfurovum sp.]
MVQTLRHFNYSSEQIGLLLNSKSGTFGVNFLVPIVFFAVYVMSIPFLYIFTWLCLQLIVFFIRIWISKKGLKAIDELDKKAIKKYFSYYLGTIFLNSLLWGSVSILVLEYTDQFFFLLYLVLLFGLASAGSFTIGIFFHAIMIFLVNTLGLAALVSFYYSSMPIDYIFSILMLVYFFFVLKASFRNHSFIVKNIEQKEQITKSHNLIKESIEYAALIQKAMLPPKKILEDYFQDHFIYLKQRDVVGGDFYSVIPLNKDELLVMVFDGVGHGVSGAFMTMLIKSTEHQIITELHHNRLKPSPAFILARFNILIKSMTEEQCDKKVMIGFDGGILYFNKKESMVNYAGAKMPLYVIKNNRLSTYKGNRKGIGFIRTAITQVFTEYEIGIGSDTKFYLATDGILDQDTEGGTQFGKKRLEDFLLLHHRKTFIEQYKNLKDELEQFVGTQAQLDDSTILGFSLK